MNRALKLLCLILLFNSCGNSLERGIEYYGSHDYEKAGKCFQRAADKGNAEAMAWMGLIKWHYDNDNYSEYYEMAIENGALQWFFDMAKSGVPEIQAYLGYCYANGIGVEKNDEEMLHWYQTAAGNGIRLAQRSLGLAYLSGDGVNKDTDKAVEWFLKAANQEDKISQRMLGRIYHGTDNEKAMYWYAKAAYKNDTESQVALGTLYLASDNNRERAFSWLKKAADAGDENAYANLGYCYATGTGVTQNIHKALDYYKRAADKGNMISCQNYAMNAYSIWFLLSDEQKDYAKQCLSKSIASGYEPAERLKEYVDNIDSRLYTGSIMKYDKNDIRTYSLPQGRYLARIGEYQTYLASTTNTDMVFLYSPDANYCWITEYERNRYPDIFKLANPFGPSIAVDLGLSVKWAPYNIGADSPEELGDRFAWGETAPKEDYTWITYKYAKGSSETVISIGRDIGGTQYDAATVNWGKNWRMPTVAEYNELINHCTFEWVEADSLFGTRGLKVTGPNGNTIFFPCRTGLFGENYYTSQDNSGFFSLENVYTFYISNSSYNINEYTSRCYGNYIRAVLDEQL